MNFIETLYEVTSDNRQGVPLEEFAANEASPVLQTLSKEATH
jgi:hypothetical protein